MGGKGKKERGEENTEEKGGNTSGTINEWGAVDIIDNSTKAKDKRKGISLMNRQEGKTPECDDSGTALTE